MYGSMSWEERSARIANPNGEVIFEGTGEIPSGWSQVAADIMVSKYFRRAGLPDGGGETSAKQVFDRLVHCWRHWGESYGYFDSADSAQVFEDELRWMLAHQVAAPNSPQWFNTGLAHEYGITGPAQGHWYVDPEAGKLTEAEDAYSRPQPHACFILSVADDLVNPGGIMDLWTREARIFKYGSGAGSNFSAGQSSGLMSFLKIGDRAAGAIKSGGTTRRAAKMVVVDLDHPDIEKFISWKADEEKKVAALVAAGYSSDFEGDAYNTVSGQNANNSVRIPDRFFDVLESDSDWELVGRVDGKVVQRVRAVDLWDRINEAAWASADPGVQYDTTINSWHTCPEDGRINASNPCSEYMFLDDTACNLASINLVKFLQDDGTFDIDGYRHAIRLWTLVLEISVLMAAYPSPEIAQRSYEYRTLGLGYANLGSLLMRQGIPYDSDEGRAICGALTAIMTGDGYAMSAAIAEAVGPFPRFEANGESMLRVIRNHRRAAYDAPAEEYEELSVLPVGIDQDLCPSLLLEAAHEAWDRALALGEEHGYRNAQLSCLAPTGTIGLLMDCDTTGVEPDFALVKFKKLAGGGYFKIANAAIEPALEHLGYAQSDIRAIMRYILGTARLDHEIVNRAKLQAKGLTAEECDAIEAALPGAFDIRGALAPWTIGAAAVTRLGFDPSDPALDLPTALGFSDADIEAASKHCCGHQTVEGAPGLDPEHYRIFDCANTCGDGERYLPVEAHIEMMAAAQPFISGSISKTANLPNEATVDDISKTYRLGWERGLKSIALYRDGCKLSQPLSSGSSDSADSGDAGFDTDAAEEQTQLTQAIHHEVDRTLGWNPFRRKLPAKRYGWTHEAIVGGQKVFLRTGEYEDGSLGELFIDMAKEGATLRSIVNCFAIAVSKGLQYGVPLEEFVDTFTFTRFEPQGTVQGHPNVKMATSVIDYVFRALGVEYLGREDLAHVKPSELEPDVEQPGLPAAEARTGEIGEARVTEAQTDEITIEVVDAGANGEVRMTHGTTSSITSEVAATGASADAMSAHLSTLMGDAPFCSTCGHITVRNGSCYRCLNCGNSMGCS
ncbi:MAG: adenosylcobalamin-dependent ribonucleoside-diphosphate reductase [Actinobacteria bacterium ATB1]|nr:adenosylcobalamin-dependent ribonucleoside-diphosphate reductase [Actinobacteria bacterium ATB1]